MSEVQLAPEYGLRRQRPSRDERRQRVDELLALVGLAGFQAQQVTRR